MAIPADNRKPLLVTGALLVSIGLGWMLATLQRVDGWTVTVRSQPRPGQPAFRAELNGYPSDRLRSEAGEGFWAPEGANWRVFLPTPMAAMRSAWRLKLQFTPQAIHQGVNDVALLLNGRILARGIHAADTWKHTIPAEKISPGDNEIELRTASENAFSFLRVRNYNGLNAAFPCAAVITRKGPFRRPTDRLGLAVLAIALGVGVVCTGWLGRRSLDRLGVPIWTAAQWTRTAAAPIVLLLGMATWNLLGTHKVIVAQWSALVLLAAYLIVSGLVCLWGNMKAMRWPNLSAAEQQRWLERRRVVVLFAAIWLAYNSNFARIGFDDGEPAPRMAISLIRYGDFNLDEYPELHGEVGTKYVKGHHVSCWSPGSALFCVPFFLVPAWLGVDAPSVMFDVLAKVSASTLTALSAVFVYLCLRRLCSTRGALWLAIAYALGTACFPISSQDTWQHASAQLSLAVAMVLLLRDEDRWPQHLLAGAFLGLTVVCRPTSLLLCVPLWLWAAKRHGVRVWIWHLLGGLPWAAFLIGYNLHYLGTIGLSGYTHVRGAGWTPDRIPSGLLGLLVSTNRGVFVFSPFLVMMLYGAWRGLRHAEPRWRRLTALTIAGITASLVMTAAWKSWHALFTYGCRYSADALPLWVMLGAFGIDRILERPVWRRVFVTLVIVSILFQVPGVYASQFEWNWLQECRLPAGYTDWSPAAWDVEDPQILWQFLFMLGIVGEHESLADG